MEFGALAPYRSSRTSDWRLTTDGRAPRPGLHRGYCRRVLPAISVDCTSKSRVSRTAHLASETSDYVARSSRTRKVFTGRVHPRFRR